MQYRCFLFRLSENYSYKQSMIFSPRFNSLLFVAVLSILFCSCDSQTPVEKASASGVLIIGNGDEPKGIDPQLTSGIIESNIERALFEGLCNAHPSDDALVLPGVAEKWSPNGDFTEWTFFLNPNAKWSDGVPVTAEDFRFSFQRMLSPEFPAEYASMLYFIENAEEYRKKKIDNFSQVGVSTPDEHTLKIKLKAPLPFLPSITLHNTWYPVPKHTILKHGKIDQPFSGWTQPENIVTNGPFKMSEWRPNHYIQVEKNPFYWDAQTVGLEGIRFLPIKNPNTEASMFLDKMMHITYTIPPDSIGYAQEKVPKAVRQETYIGTRMVRCNMTLPVLQDKNIRQALSYSIDRQAIVEKILQGGQKVAKNLTPPFGEYRPDASVSFSPEKAKEAFAKSPHAGNFPELKFLTTDSDTNRRVAEAMQAMWKEHLGISVRLVQREWKSYLEMRSKLEFDLMDGAWIGDYLDPTTFLDLFIGGNGNNNTGWADPQYEGLLKEAEKLSDPIARYQKLVEAENYLMEELPILPYYHYTTNYLVSPKVNNWHPLLLKQQPYKFLKLSSN